MKYIKPSVKVRKIKLNLFLSNRYKGSAGFPIGQAFAQTPPNSSIQPPGTGDGGLVPPPPPPDPNCNPSCSAGDCVCY